VSKVFLRGTKGLNISLKVLVINQKLAHMKNHLHFVLSYIFFLQTINLFAQSISPPLYYELLKKERPNIHEINNAYDTYYKEHLWVKNNYTRAYYSFVRQYPLYTFDDKGYPILPQERIQLAKTQVNNSVSGKNLSQRATQSGRPWKALPVAIERSDCYYTGQNGVIRSLAVHPSNPNIVFAGGLNGGLWKSVDKGETWSKDLLRNHPFIGRTNKIVFAPSNPQFIYLATNAGIFKSTNGGDRFTVTSIDYTSSFPNIDYGGDDFRSEYMYVDVAPNNENLIVASDINPSGLVAKIARSTNGGNTWSKVDFGNKNFPIDVKFHPTNPDIVYTLILENKQIKFYRSTDGGRSFNQITDGFANYTNPDGKEIRAKIGLTPAQPNLVAFYLNVSDQGATFYKSTNSGRSFERACCGSTNNIVNKSDRKRDFFGEGFSAVQIRWATTIAISDVDPNFVAAATNVQPRFSMDQMENWYWKGERRDVPRRPQNVFDPTRICGTTIHGDIQDMIIRGDDVWVANDGGIALSENKGITFEEKADGIPITMALGFDMTPGPRDIMVAAMDHNGVVVRDESIYGSEWKPLGGGDASSATINPVDDTWLYAKPSGSNIIQRPTRGPSHRHPRYQNTTQDFGTGYRQRFNNVQFHPNDHYTLFNVDYNSFSIQKSTNNGRTWSSIRQLQSGSAWSYAEVKISRSNPEVLYVSDESNGNNTLHRSTNGGRTWTSVIPNALRNGDKVRNIEIDSQDENVVWLSTNGRSPKVFKTTDGGRSWTNYSTDLEQYKIFSMIHDKDSDGGVYLGTRYGVFYRDNNSIGWERYGSEIPGASINFLKINNHKKIIRAATNRGIYENQLATVVDPVLSTTNLEELTHGFSIYPNPVENTLNIVGLKTPLTPLIVQIMDTQGRVIFENKNSNTTIDVSLYTSGLYFLKTTQNKRSIVKKWIKK